MRVKRLVQVQSLLGGNFENQQESYGRTASDWLHRALDKEIARLEEEELDILKDRKNEWRKMYT